MFVVAALFLFPLLFCGKWLWNRRKLYLLSWKMDGPFSLPFVGSALPLLYQNNLGFVDNLMNKFQSPFRVWLGSKLFIMLDEPEDIEVVLTNPDCINREEGYQYLKEAIGADGIFTLEGQKWKKHRKILGPSFNYNVVLGYLPVFNKKSNQLITELNQQLGKGPFNLSPLIKAKTLDSFLDATIGTDLTKDEKKIYANYIIIGQQLVSKRLFLPWFQSEFIWKLTNYPNILKNIRTFMHEVLNRKNIAEESDEFTMIKRLLRISETNAEFTLEDVKAEAVDSLIAASDTSAWGVAFLILMLAIHPEFQEQVVTELRHVIDADSDITRDHLEKFIFMERCINETLRLFPIVPIIARKCEGKMQLKNFEISHGANFVIVLRTIHRKAKFWGPNSHIFNPDHFLPENIAKRPAFSYIPFSGGPRNCIGNRYAMIVMKCMAAQLLRKFKFTSPLKLSDLVVRMDINIFLLNGHMVQVHPREF